MAQKNYRRRFPIRKLNRKKIFKRMQHKAVDILEDFFQQTGFVQIQGEHILAIGHKSVVYYGTEVLLPAEGAVVRVVRQPFVCRFPINVVFHILYLGDDLADRPGFFKTAGRPPSVILDYV